MNDNEQNHTPVSEGDVFDPLHPSPRLPIKEPLIILLVILLGLVGGSFIPKAYSYLFAHATDSVMETVDNKEGGNFREGTAAFDGITLEARSAFVWDVTSQRALYKKNEATEQPLASITKLMTALVAHELLSGNASVVIAGESANQESASGLAVGQSFSASVLSDLIMLASANDGAHALALAAGGELASDRGLDTFVAAMNVRADELGLWHTSFKNPTGLDISQTEAGAYGSAEDVALLMEYIIENQPSILESTRTSEARFFTEEGTFVDAHNTNYYIDRIPGLIGSKTGYTDLAGGNLVVAFDAGLNRPIVVVVLGSSRSGRFEDVMKLVEATTRQVSGL